MTRGELNSAYYSWLCSFVEGTDHYIDISYHRLFRKLYDTEFNYILDMDGNRAEDGIDLRYRFGKEYGVADYVIAEGLDIRPCSIFEMMLALAIRCEDDIMLDDEYGDRISQWFWSMIVSLGLGKMSDNGYDEETVNYILDKFLSRRYLPDGRGGLFTLEHPIRDLRGVEIWYQAMWYLNEVS